LTQIDTNNTVPYFKPRHQIALTMFARFTDGKPLQTCGGVPHEVALSEDQTAANMTELWRRTSQQDTFGQSMGRIALHCIALHFAEYCGDRLYQGLDMSV